MERGAKTVIDRNRTQIEQKNHPGRAGRKKLEGLLLARTITDLRHRNIDQCESVAYSRSGCIEGNFCKIYTLIVVVWERAGLGGVESEVRLSRDDLALP
jgi:hypothetical protein